MKESLQLAIEQRKQQLATMDDEHEKAKSRVQATLRTLQTADALLTPEIEALLEKLREIGVRID